MEAEAIILADPYTYKFLKSLTHSAMYTALHHVELVELAKRFHN